MRELTTLHALLLNGVGPATALAIDTKQNDGEGRVSYESLQACIDSFSAQLEKVAVRGSAVGLLASHSLESAAALIALASSGWITAPLSPTAQEESIRNTLQDVMATIILVS